MIIKHNEILSLDASETNTDKLSDIEAMILEKSEELRKLCFDASRQAVIIVDARWYETGAAYHFWNLKLKQKELQPIQQDGSDPFDKKRAYENMLNLIHNFLMSLTDKQMGIMNLKMLNDMSQTLAIYNSENIRLKEALKKISEFDGESIWSDDRDDAAREMLDIAKKALS